MIFKRNKNSSENHEPKTKSGLFEAAADKAPPTGLSPTQSPDAEPPTRDAIFKDAALQTKHKPPVGWMAVVSGPDKGQIVALGYEKTNINLAGAAATYSVSYDPAQTQFTLHGGSEDFVLKARQTVEIGGNTLIFIPLCADGFDWRTS